MHPSLAEVVAVLDAAHLTLRQAVDAVPSGMHAQRPAPDRWSANEVVEHLMLVERRFTGNIATAVAEARAAGLENESGAREPLSREVLGFLADRTQRRNAPEGALPTGALDRDAAWAGFEEARAGFYALLSEVDGLALGRVMATHRFFGPLNVYQWVELVAGHERRHAAQITEIANQFART